MGDYDHLIPKDPAAPAAAGAYDHLIPAPAPRPPRPWEAGAPSVPISGRPEGYVPRPWEAGAPTVPISGATGEAPPSAPDNSRAPMSGPTALAATILDNATLSITRKPTAALHATIGGITGSDPGSTWGQRYDNTVRALQDRYAEADKTLGPTVANTASAVAGLPADYLLGGGGKVYRVLEGAARAAVPAFVRGMSESGPGFGETMWGGVKEGGKALGLGTVLGTIGRALPGGRAAADAEARAARGVPPAQHIAQGSAHYQTLDDAGVAWAPAQAAGMRQGLGDLLANSRIPAGAVDLRRYIDDLTALSNGPMSWGQLQNLRSLIAEGTRGNDDNIRRASREVLGVIDDMARSAPPIINPRGIDVPRIWAEAGRRTAQGHESAKILEKFNEAERSASRAKGPNIIDAEQAAALQLEKTARKRGGSGPYTPEVQEQLARIREGTAPGQSRMDNAGRWAQENATKIGLLGSGLATTAGLMKGIDPSSNLATTLVGIPIGAAVSGAGRLLSSGAAGRSRESVNELARLLTTGTRAPMQQAPHANLSRADLANLIREQDFMRLAANAIGRQTP